MKVNSPASGLRLALKAGLVGSMRPGLKESCVAAAAADDAYGRGGRAARPVDEG